MVNVVVLIGRQARDADLRTTSSGVSVASFTLAVDRPFKDSAGKRECDFIDCVAWRQSGEFIAQYGGKGRLCAVRGRLAIRQYDGKDGSKRRVAEVVCDEVRLLDRPATDGGRREERSANADDEAPW